MSTVELFPHNDIRSVRVKTNFSYQRPYSISFQCSRIQPPGGDPSTIYIHPEIFNVFMNAIQGKSHEDMIPNDKGICESGNKSHCGNRRGDLAECRCDDLNRKTKPYIRHQFENDIIEKILYHPKIEQSLSSLGSFQFNLAVFCSGRLLGEEVLLFRLLHALHNRGVSGTINVFLIDRGEYGPAIALGDSSETLKRHRYLQQFLTEICGCLPPLLAVNGTIFAEADHYIAQTKADVRFKHDLLIGADMEGAYPYMSRINSEASMHSEQKPLVLVGKSDGVGIPSVCEISAFGQLTNCYTPFNPSGSNSQQQALKRSNPQPPQRSSNPQRPTSSPSWELPVAISAVGVVLIALIIITAANSRR